MSYLTMRDLGQEAVPAQTVAVAVPTSQSSDMLRSVVSYVAEISWWKAVLAGVVLGAGAAIVKQAVKPKAPDDLALLRILREKGLLRNPARDDYATLLLAEHIAEKDPTIISLVEKVSKGKAVPKNKTVDVHGKKIKVTRALLEKASQVALERQERGFSGPD